ncbi:MAG: hypothetical protein E7037_08225 [Verrucomicrobia bacterium]|nr:hypothetical protein [Verrucomicrobiota bacterium]
MEHLIEEKLKGLGRSLDLLRDEGKQRAVKIDHLAKDFSDLKATFAQTSAELSHTKQDVRDLRALVWKIVAFLTSGCAAAQYFFNNNPSL